MAPIDEQDRLFSQRLRSARRDKRLSLRELSERARVDRATIHRIEHGDSGGSVSTLNKLAAALGVSADWLRGAPDEARQSRHSEVAAAAATESPEDAPAKSPSSPEGPPDVPWEVALLLARGAVTPVTVPELRELVEIARIFRKKSHAHSRDAVDMLELHLCQMRGDWDGLIRASERLQGRQTRDRTA